MALVALMIKTSEQTPSKDDDKDLVRIEVSVEIGEQEPTEDDPAFALLAAAKFMLTQYISNETFKAIVDTTKQVEDSK